MKLIKASHYHAGTGISKRTGKPVKAFKHRMVYECGECGAIVVRAGYSGLVARNCGCKQYCKHGFAAIGHPVYKLWHGIRNRCFNKKDKAWPRYGGRGIKLCHEWASDFLNFHKWALEAGYKPGLFIDRINNDGNYEPANCRFVTPKESNRNRSNTITKQQAIAVHGLLKQGIPMKTIAGLTNVPRHTVENINNGICWKEDDLA